MTADSAMGPVQAAVYAVLAADGELAGRVFDDVPENAVLPYVVVGESIETPDNYHGGFGRQTVEILHIWSDYRGMTEATTLVSRVVALLDHKPLTVPGRAHISTRFEFTQTLKDPDRPELRHVPVRFRIETETE